MKLIEFIKRRLIRPAKRIFSKTELLKSFRRIHLNRLALKIYRKDLISVPNRLEGAHFFLAVVAIFRGEDAYLREWLEFHLMMGVEHFFLYDNGLEESSKKLLQPYIDKGLVTHIPWPDLPGLRDNNWLGPNTLSIQQLAYGNCVREFKQNFEWLMQLDLDEFMFPASPACNSISDVLQTLEADKVLGIRVPSLTFGSSGHIEHPGGLIIRNFTWSRSKPDGPVKSIAHAKYLARDLFMGPHWFRYTFWRECQNLLLGYPRIIGSNKSKALFCLNHYEVKSQEAYLEKARINAKGYMAGKENLERFYFLDEEANEVENVDIQRFLPQLEKRLENPA